MIVPSPGKQPAAVLGGLEEVRCSAITGLHHGSPGGGTKRVLVGVRCGVDHARGRLLPGDDLLRRRPDVLDHLLDGFGVGSKNWLFDDLGVAIALRGLPGLLPGEGAHIGVDVGVVVGLPLVVGDVIARLVVLLDHVDAAVDGYGIRDIDIDLPGVDDLAGGCDSLDAS